MILNPWRGTPRTLTGFRGFTPLGRLVAVLVALAGPLTRQDIVRMLAEAT